MDREEELSIAPRPGSPENPSDAIFTLANLITFGRVMLVPLFFILLFGRDDRVAAVIVFAIASGTDWIDGQLARRTNTVTELGKRLDPLVDRLLLASGVLALFALGELPLWMLLVIIMRDVYLSFGTIYIQLVLKKHLDVIFTGKAATMALLVGFVLMLLAWPTVTAPHLTDASWLVGFNGGEVSVGIYFLYAGIVLSLITALVYTFQGSRMIRSTDR